MADFQSRKSKYLENAEDSEKSASKGGTPKSGGSPASGRWSPSLTKCAICDKTVYPMEQITVDMKPLHKTCFKCDHCHKVLSVGTYAALDGKTYCKPHFKQLFALKGNYNEGFGTEPRKHKWDRSNSTEQLPAAKDGTPEGSVRTGASLANISSSTGATATAVAGTAESDTSPPKGASPVEPTGSGGPASPVVAPSPTKHPSPARTGFDLAGEDAVADVSADSDLVAPEQVPLPKTPAADPEADDHAESTNHEEIQ